MEALPQVVANSLSAAAFYLLAALGFGLIYSTARFFHFAHGAVMALGAYCSLLLVTKGASIPVAMLGGVACSVAAGCSLELLIYRPLRRRLAPSLVLLLSSLGAYTILENAIALAWGNDTKTLPGPDGVLTIWGARVTVIQASLVLASCAVMLALGAVLKRTRTGLALRAVASDDELARICGLDSDRAVLWAFAAGSAVGGLGGILGAMDSAVTPSIGMSYLMTAVVVVIVGGIGSLRGTLLAAILLASAQHFVTLRVSSLWQGSIAFVVLLFFLLLRPEGLLGERGRAGARA